MIVRGIRPRPPAWWRFWAHRSPRPVAPPGIVLDEATFELVLLKEVARCERRLADREFAILLLHSAPLPQGIEAAFLSRVRSRLRLTDDVGYWQNQPCVLLPETNCEGAEQVAADLKSLAASSGLQIEILIRMFPWEDPIIARSVELSGEGANLDGQRHLVTDRIDASQPGEDEEVAVARHAFLGGQESIWPVLRTPWWKRAVDWIGAGLGLTLLSPLLVATALAIRLDSSGPALFVQSREGKDGRIFKIYKFRTMHSGSEKLQCDLRAQSEQDGPAFKLTDDPRVTRLGRYLRKTCVDELPQLLNVLRGEMSLVGPRPLPVNESVASQGWQRQRLRVLPGLTCIWQVEGGRKVAFDDWMRMDLEYIQKRSFWLDVQIILRTIGLVLAHRGSV